MIDSEQHPYVDPYVEWIAREARRPVRTEPAARDRIMAAVHAEPRPVRRTHIWQRLFETRAFHFSPIASGLIAAGLVGIGVLAGTFAHDRDVRLPGGSSPMAVVPQSQLPVSQSTVRFAFVAPQAGRVFVVGDFNGWDSTRTPMVRAADSGVWTVELPLSAGRHLYSFIVDGSWSADPTAPLAPDDGFGQINSVKVVRGGSAL